MTHTLSPAQQTQLDNRDATGQWKAKEHAEADDASDVLGIDQQETVYSTRDEAFERGLLPVLGEHADDYDHDGLARDLIRSDESSGFRVSDPVDDDALERHCYNMEDHHVEAFLDDANADAPPHQWIDPEDFNDEIDVAREENFTYHRDIQAEEGVSLTHAHYDHYSMVTQAQCEEAADRAQTSGTPYFTVTSHDGKTYGSVGSINIHYPDDHPKASEEPYAQIALDEGDWDEDGEPIDENVRAHLVAGDGTYAYAAEDEDLAHANYVEETLDIEQRFV